MILAKFEWLENGFRWDSESNLILFTPARAIPSKLFHVSREIKRRVKRGKGKTVKFWGRWI